MNAHVKPLLDRTGGHDTRTAFLRHLMMRGAVTADQMQQILHECSVFGASISDVILAQRMLTSTWLAKETARFYDVTYIDLFASPPDAALLMSIDPAFCLQHAVIPCRQRGDHIWIATARPDVFDQVLQQLNIDQPVKMVITSEDQIHDVIATAHRDNLAQEAETTLNPDHSCRSWESYAHLRGPLVIAGMLLIATLLAVWPQAVFVALLSWAVLTLMAGTCVKAITLISATLPQKTNTVAKEETPTEWPTISVLVPLFKEPEIAGELVKRLAALSYPKSKLDVILVTEEVDHITRQALHGAGIPGWMRVLTVPQGQVQTKPRAMNYALDFCCGDIIGVYDAEDAPEPDQLNKVARRFQNAPDDVVCLQGLLDYYNSRQNWLARCFSIEYATWFRVLLRGMSRIGFAIPLGGTTLFFKRSALEKLGRWDAHNVTEDADLGIRLARFGYRAEVIDTTTREEAMCFVWPWIKQRSRWLKGYMVTYLVHMRRPLQLYRDLGAWKFFGFQTHFIAALSQFLLAPILWSFWLIVLGFAHPLDRMLGSPAIIGLTMLFLTVECLTLLTSIVAVATPTHRHLLAWVIGMHLYFSMGVVAVYKALYELIFAPFFWDKTEHGHSLAHAGSMHRPRL